MSITIKTLPIVCLFSFLILVPLDSKAASAPESFAPLVKKEMPAVVNISTKQVVKVQQPSPFGDPKMDEFFYRFFGGRPQREGEQHPHVPREIHLGRQCTPMAKRKRSVFRG